MDSEILAKKKNHRKEISTAFLSKIKGNGKNIYFLLFPIFDFQIKLLSDTDDAVPLPSESK